jgi:hypothetical protein
MRYIFVYAIPDLLRKSGKARALSEAANWCRRSQ